MKAVSPLWLAVCGIAFCARLAEMMPAANGAEVTSAVVIPGDDVIHLYGSISTSAAIPHADLAALAGFGEYGSTDCWPIGRESCCPV